MRKRAQAARHTSGTPRSGAWRPWIIGLCVALVTFWAFQPALDAGWVKWDDDKNFLENEAWRGLSLQHLRWMFTTFHLGPYQPLAWLSLAIDHALWGMDPGGYHATNVILQCATALACFFFARRMFARCMPALRGALELDLCAAFAALLFAAHPLRVESVAWITERRDVLAGFFLVLSALAWLDWIESKRRGAYALSLAAFVLSLGSKALGVMAPLAWLVLDVTVLARWNGRLSGDEVGGEAGAEARAERRSLRALVLEKAPFLAWAFAFGVVAWWGQRALGPTMLTWESFGLAPRLVTGAYAHVFYVAKTFAPTELSALYPLPKPFVSTEPRFLIAVAIVVLALAATWLTRRRAPALAAAVASYVILLLPVSGLSQAGPQLVADRYSYLPSIPLALLAGGVLLHLFTTRPLTGGVLAVGAVATIPLLVLLTRAQTRTWHDTISLFENACRSEPANPLVRRNLILARMDFAAAETDPVRRRAAWNEALAECQRGIEASPDPACLSDAAAIFLVLASEEPAESERVLGLALDHAKRAIELGDRTGETWPDAYETQIIVLSQLGRTEEALPAARWLVEHSPTEARHRQTLGELLLELGRAGEAIEPLNEAFKLEPSTPRTSYDLASAEQKLGRKEAALAHARRAVELSRAQSDPDLAAAEALVQELDAGH